MVGRASSKGRIKGQTDQRINFTRSSLMLYEYIVSKQNLNYKNENIRLK